MEPIVSSAHRTAVYLAGPLDLRTLFGFFLSQVGSAEAWSFKNTALAAQTFILSCTAHGLATAPMEGFDARR